MDRLNEILEAEKSLQKVIIKMNSALTELESATSWGFLDLMGGGMFSSFMKRDAINKINKDIKEISNSLKISNKKLEDLKLQTPIEIDSSFGEVTLDIWFDNIFTDFKVQEELENKINELKKLKICILGLIEKLNSEINENEKQL